MAQPTNIEIWEENAKGCFLTAIGFSIFGSICFWAILPWFNVHSGGAIIMIGVMFMTGIFTAGAGIGGLIAAGILFFKHRIISWRGFVSGLVAVVFLITFR